MNFLEDKNFKQMEPIDDNDEYSEHMTASLFVELMAQFYKLGWMRGTGGAMGAMGGKKQFFVSPSALQKERIKECDIFIYNLAEKKEESSHELASRPRNPAVSISSCAPLFSHIMMATGSKCVLHSHSINSNLITQLVKENYFSMSHQEYIKGIYDPFTGKNMKYEDTLTIPIIDNAPSENLLLPGLELAMLEYPRATAVLVRNHGLFVWGPTWQEAKIQMECTDYLLELGAKMIERGLPLVREEATNVKTSESRYHLSYTDDDT